MQYHARPRTVHCASEDEVAAAIIPTSHANIFPLKFITFLTPMALPRFFCVLVLTTLSSLAFTACSLKLHQFENVNDFLERPLAEEERDTIYVIESEHIKQIRSLLKIIKGDQEAIVDNLGLRLAFDDVAGFREKHSLVLQDHVVNAMKQCGYEVLEPETISDQAQEILNNQRLILDGLMLHSQRMFVGGLGHDACPGESILKVNQIIKNTALYDRMSDAEQAALQQQV